MPAPPVHSSGAFSGCRNHLTFNPRHIGASSTMICHVGQYSFKISVVCVVLMRGHYLFRPANIHSRDRKYFLASIIQLLPEHTAGKH
jgi:hypothetical protein